MHRHSTQAGVPHDCVGVGEQYIWASNLFSECLRLCLTDDSRIEGGPNHRGFREGQPALAQPRNFHGQCAHKEKTLGACWWARAGSPNGSPYSKHSRVQRARTLHAANIGVGREGKQTCFHHLHSWVVNLSCLEGAVDVCACIFVCVGRVPMTWERSVCPLVQAILKASQGNAPPLTLWDRRSHSEIDGMAFRRGLRIALFSLPSDIFDPQCLITPHSHTS
jgi:hypothetical protein